HPQMRSVRMNWTLALLAFGIHLVVAFGHVDNWSYANAFERTRQATGVGEGLYVSFLFTLLWTADVVWWWLRPASYTSRPKWIGWCLHLFMGFIMFNGTVVFESGPVRWFGIVMFLGLAALAARRFWRRAGGHITPQS